MLPKHEYSEMLLVMTMKQSTKKADKNVIIDLLHMINVLKWPGTQLKAFFSFFLHRTVVTKRELKLFRLADNDKCIYCSNADSIEYTFIDCRESIKLYSQIISWFNHCQDTAITLSNEKVAFHDIRHVTDMLSGPVRRRLDLLIILVKEYICSAKHLQKELSLDELVKKLTT